MFSVALSVPKAYSRTFRPRIPLRPSPLASTLPCGVRTFLSPVACSVRLYVGPLERGSDHPACPRKPHHTPSRSLNQRRPDGHPLPDDCARDRILGQRSRQVGTDRRFPRPQVAGASARGVNRHQPASCSLAGLTSQVDSSPSLSGGPPRASAPVRRGGRNRAAPRGGPQPAGRRAQASPSCPRCVPGRV